MASKSKRKRDYAKEYLIRIARGLAGGKSRAQARGHARASDVTDQATDGLSTAQTRSKTPSS
jgi:hypothetical protein